MAGLPGFRAFWTLGKGSGGSRWGPHPPSLAPFTPGK